MTDLQKLFVFSGTFIALSLLSIPGHTYAAAPTVNAFSPADNAAGVSRETNLVITFDQTVIASGSTLATPSRIRIFQEGGALVENITASGSQVSVNSAVVTINPSTVLNKSTTYYVQIETHAFVNAADETYAGISNSTTWNFTTIGGGAAANRLLRERLMEGQPEYYDTEPPSLSSVGIFTPVASSGTEEMQVHSAAPEPVQRTVSAELEEARKKRAEKLMRALSTQAKPAASQQYESALHERVCTRVEHRFAGNRTMIDRINQRLTKRFGFTCDL